MTRCRPDWTPYRRRRPEPRGNCCTCRRRLRKTVSPPRHHRPGSTSARRRMLSVRPVQHPARAIARRPTTAWPAGSAGGMAACPFPGDRPAGTGLASYRRHRPSRSATGSDWRPRPVRPCRFRHGTPRTCPDGSSKRRVRRQERHRPGRRGRSVPWISALRRPQGSRRHWRKRCLRCCGCAAPPHGRPTCLSTMQASNRPLPTIRRALGGAFGGE